MIIGISKKIKENEYRLSMRQHNVQALTSRGHLVLVGTQASIAIDFSDRDYRNADASICVSAKEIFTCADMIVKVKEPQAIEIAWLHEEQILFSYLHLAPNLNQTTVLLKVKQSALLMKSLAYQIINYHCSHLGQK